MWGSVRYLLWKYKLYVLSILGIFLSLFLYGQSINITNTKIYDQYNNLRSSDFNDFFSKTKDLYVYKFDLNILFDDDRKLVIYPNDCIKKVEINWWEYYFDPKQDMCYSEEGITLDLSKYAHIWKNFINIYTQQWWHNRAMTIWTSWDDSMQFLFFTIVVILFRAIMAGIIRSSSFPRSYKFIFIILFGVILWFSYTYFINSGFTKRTNDVVWHIDYIRIVAYGDLLPSANRCWVCYHPPIYYRFSAIIYKISSILWMLNPYNIIRLFGIWFYSVTLWFGVKFLDLAFKDKPISFWLSVLLLLFRPLNFFYWPRVINDNFFYLFSFIFLYLTLYSYKNGINTSIIVWTFVVMWLGLFTKSNFIIRLPLLFITIYRNFSIRDSNNKRLFKKSLISNIKNWYKYYIIYFIILSWYILFQAIFKSKELVWNISIFWLVWYIWDVDLFTTFTSFDYTNFIHNTKRWHNISTDESNYFWNYMLKTMLYHENSIYNNFKSIIWVRMNFVFLILIILTFIKLLTSSKDKLFYIVWFVVPIVSMMAYRWRYPYIWSMHTRYIRPYILFFLYFLCSDIDIDNLKKFKIITYVKLILVVIFIVLCVLFSLPPYY